MTTVTDSAYEQLDFGLRRGEFGPGSRLPGERELSTRLGVSRVTVRRALSRLEVEGRLERSAQRGWYVTREVVGESPSLLQSFSEMARARGLHATSRVLRHRTRPATFEEAEQLRIAPAAPVVELRRLRGMDGHPVCVDLVVLRYEGLEAIATADMTDTSLYERLATLCGVRLQRSAYSVQADAADAEIAQLLNCAVGAPVLVGSEIAYAANGQPVLLGVNRYRGDAYRFRADLFRPGPG
ncbi:MAG: GntR family transcriptional regulator [Propionibacteriaceae bacterium]|jgi:GntR family transcriptional regulator|nr:GntR family transcriptional regulator [Propionibacteriaceae bacterium]